MSILDVVAVVAIVGYVIGRQLLGEPLRGKRLIALPLILTVVGAIDLGRNGHHPGGADMALIAVEALVALVIGLGQGSIMRLEARDGALWGQMPRRSLWLWGALVASHGALDLVALGVGAHVAASTAPILLILGLNRVAQALIIGSRTLKAGIPFAPEKDGSTFLSGTFGSGPGSNRHIDSITNTPSGWYSAPGSSEPSIPANRPSHTRGGCVSGALFDTVRSHAASSNRPSRRSAQSPAQPGPTGDDRPLGEGGLQTALGITADWLEGRRSRR